MYACVYARVYCLLSGVCIGSKTHTHQRTHTITANTIAVVASVAICAATLSVLFALLSLRLLLVRVSEEVSSTSCNEPTEQQDRAVAEATPSTPGLSDRAPEESGSTTQEQSWSRRRAPVV